MKGCTYGTIVQLRGRGEASLASRVGGSERLRVGGVLHVYFVCVKGGVVSMRPTQRHINWPVRRCEAPYIIHIHLHRH